jgi:ABC-type branched-subunit amino acid transport system ATPase component
VPLQLPWQIHLRPADHVLDTHDYGKLYSLLGEFVTVTLSGGDMESGHAVRAIAPVLCAGVGVRSDSRWALRMASFRLDQSGLGAAALGIATPRSPAASALIGLLSGQVAPDYGSLRVLGYDMTVAAGRAAVRRQTGVAGRSSRPVATTRIRALIHRAAKKSGQRGTDRQLLVAAILDRLGLVPWSDVAIGAAPELIARKARIAVATVHQPKLLLIDSLLDQLQPLDRTVLADVIRDLGRDTAVIALGADADALMLICDRVISLSGSILVGTPRTPSMAGDGGDDDKDGDDLVSIADGRR